MRLLYYRRCRRGHHPVLWGLCVLLAVSSFLAGDPVIGLLFVWAAYRMLLTPREER